jgi:hypothetical protein
LNDFFSAPAAEALLAELGAAVTPLTGAELRKRAASRGVKPKAADKARDDLVSAGRVHAWSGKRYALEPESAFVERQILAALADDRQTAGALAARLAPAGIKPAAIKKALPTLAAAGKLYLAGAGKRQLISRQPLPALAKVLVDVATHLPITRKELAARAVEQLPWHTPAQANKEIAYLLGTGALRQHKEAKLLFAPPDDAAAFLRRVAEQAYQRAMAEWSKVLGVPAPQQPSSVDNLILDAILRIEPQKGMLVTMRQLRRSKWLSGVSKEQFDQAIFRLAKDRKIFISPHPSPAYLSAEEREWLPRDEDGVYYGGLCWRD